MGGGEGGGHILAGVFVLKHDGVQTKRNAVALFYFKSAITVEGAGGRDGGVGGGVQNNHGGKWQKCHHT